MQNSTVVQMKSGLEQPDLSAKRTVSQEQERLLKLLAPEGAVARVEDGVAVVFGRKRGVSLRIGSVQATVAAELVSEGALDQRKARTCLELTINEAGLARLRRIALGSGGDRFAGQHFSIGECRDGSNEQVMLTVNEAESPLLWLRRRKGKAGHELIGDAEFAAGERLRSELTRARMLPRLTADWERPAIAGTGGGAGLNPTESMIVAKQRADAALSAVGPEFSGLLMDVCGFLKSIDQIERERGWPVRSAKVVLVLALQRLARHYGYSNEARGTDHSGRMRSWTGAGPRPDFIADTESRSAVDPQDCGKSLL